MISSFSENNLQEAARLMSENQAIETDNIAFQNPRLQMVALLSLFALAVLIPSICFILFTILFAGSPFNELIYFLFIMITFMFSPYAVMIQWESLTFACVLLAAIVFIWPKQFKGKAWCAGLVLLFHAIVGGILISMRIS